MSITPRTQAAGTRGLTKQVHALESLEQRSLLSGSMGPRPDDRFEPNDTAAQVIAAPEGVAGSSNLGAFEGHAEHRALRLVDRRDMFRIVLNAEGEAGDGVRIKFNTKQGNLDMRLFNAAGQTVGKSMSNTNNESISLEGREAGEYFIQIIGRKNATNSNYRLWIDVEPKQVDNGDDDGGTDGGGDDGTPDQGSGDGAGGGGNLGQPTLLDDDYENDNDSIAQVRALATGGTSANFGLINQSFSLNSLKLSDHVDYYRFELSADRAAHACVRVASLEPLNMILFNSAGQSIALADAYNGVDTIGFTNLAAGEYFLQVSHYALDNPVNVDYALTFSFPGT